MNSASQFMARPVVRFDFRYKMPFWDLQETTSAKRTHDPAANRDQLCP